MAEVFKLRRHHRCSHSPQLLRSRLTPSLKSNFEALNFTPLKITDTKKNNGKDLNKLLYDSYYDSTDVHFEDVKLAIDIEEDNVRVPFIDGIRDIFMDGIIAQIKSYFSNSDLKNFEIFLPKKIPDQISGALTYGVEDINHLCEIFKMS